MYHSALQPPSVTLPFYAEVTHHHSSHHYYYSEHRRRLDGNHPHDYYSTGLHVPPPNPNDSCSPPLSSSASYTQGSPRLPACLSPASAAPPVRSWHRGRSSSGSSSALLQPAFMGEQRLQLHHQPIAQQQQPVTNEQPAAMPEATRVLGGAQKRTRVMRGGGGGGEGGTRGGRAAPHARGPPARQQKRRRRRRLT